MLRQPATYMLASSRNGTLYIGVTSDLIARIWKHRDHLVDGFTKKYEVMNLIWYEFHATMEEAIQREKRIKKWNRAWKLQLIDAINPSWRDLWPDITDQLTGSNVLGSHLRGDDELRKNTSNAGTSAAHHSTPLRTHHSTASHAYQ